MKQSEWLSIPVLKGGALEQTLLFWENLGFTKTYSQKSPYAYGVIRRGDYEIHFHGAKDSASGVTCLVIVTSVESTHAAFSQRLKQVYGKVPSAGVPRISRMKPGQTRFTVVDPSHNAVIFIKRGGEDNDVYTNADRKALTPLQKSLALAIRLRDLKLDYPAAFKVIRNGLHQAQNEKPIDFARALHVKADLAFLMDDIALQQRTLSELINLQLTVDEQERIEKEFP